MIYSARYTDVENCVQKIDIIHHRQKSTFSFLLVLFLFCLLLCLLRTTHRFKKWYLWPPKKEDKRTRTSLFVHCRFPYLRSLRTYMLFSLLHTHKISLSPIINSASLTLRLKKCQNAHPLLTLTYSTH